MFVFPVAGRYDDGVPKAAIAFDVGAVPTAYVSGERNFLTVPLVLGFGVPLSPHQAVTITPWFEMAPIALVQGEVVISLNRGRVVGTPWPRWRDDVAAQLNAIGLENRIQVRARRHLEPGRDRDGLMGRQRHAEAEHQGHS